MDGVQDSVVRNNLVHDAHAKGITLYQIDAADASKRNIVINNTVLVAADGQAPLRINHDASDNTILNNIFLSDAANHAWVDAEESGLIGATIDYNITTAIALVGGVVRDDWRSEYGFDEHSIVVTNTGSLFADIGSDDFHLRSPSAAVNAGTTANAPPRDIEGVSRPAAGGVDIGAYEWSPTAPAKPRAPSLLTVALRGATGAHLTWHDNADDETSFVVRQKMGADGAWETIGRIGADATSYDAPDLRAGQRYYFAVRAENQAGASAYSNYATVTLPSVSGSGGDGLSAKYFNNRNFTGTMVSRIDRQVEFNWGSGTPAPLIARGTFSVQWTGQIVAPASGTFTFHTDASGGVRLRIKGRTLIDRWSDGSGESSGSYRMEAGRAYDVELIYFHNTGGAFVSLLWSGSGLSKQVIPREYLQSAID
jgi:hypothetical protein